MAPPDLQTTMSVTVLAVPRLCYALAFVHLTLIVSLIVWFNRLDIHVTDHEEHVLMRRFDHNGDGRISMEEFYNTLAEEF